VNDLILTTCYPCSWDYCEGCLDGFHGETYLECLCGHGQTKTFPSTTGSDDPFSAST
jgi:hypothetical protein